MIKTLQNCPMTPREPAFEVLKCNGCVLSAGFWNHVSPYINPLCSQACCYSCIAGLTTGFACMAPDFYVMLWVLLKVSSDLAPFWIINSLDWSGELRVAVREKHMTIFHTNGFNHQVENLAWVLVVFRGWRPPQPVLFHVFHSRGHVRDSFCISHVIAIP